MTGQRIEAHLFDQAKFRADCNKFLGPGRTNRIALYKFFQTDRRYFDEFLNARGSTHDHLTLRKATMLAIYCDIPLDNYINWSMIDET